MKFFVDQVANGYTVVLDEGGETHVARTAEDVAEVIVNALGIGQKSAKAKKARKARGPNKKKAVTENAAALSGIV